jgi:hypothetical protein
LHTEDARFYCHRIVALIIRTAPPPLSPLPPPRPPHHHPPPLTLPSQGVIKEVLRAGNICVTPASTFEDFFAQLQEAERRSRAERAEDGEADAGKEVDSKLAKVDADFKWVQRGRRAL